ncbi:MAG: urease accessory protein [Bacteroidota bacterium]
MDGTFPLLLAALVGFGHAFEADHLLAVSTLVSRSRSNRQVLFNGFYWGLGHTSTIFFIGLLLIIFQVNELKLYFEYFEIFVGIMLIILGIVRLVQKQRSAKQDHHHHSDREAYGIGLVHGLAGSGGLVLLVMADISSQGEALAYLALFGLGSALGMSVAASIMRLPILNGNGSEWRKQAFTWLSSLLCIGYGIFILTRFI